MTWRTLRTISHLLMVNAQVLEAYIHFMLLYTSYHILPELTIKYLINEDDEPTTSFKLKTGTKLSISYLHVLLCPCVVRKATAHLRTKVLNMTHQA